MSAAVQPQTQTVWDGAGRRIHMQEVGMRDGLQMEQAFVPTDEKIALANALSAAGLDEEEDLFSPVPRVFILASNSNLWETPACPASVGHWPLRMAFCAIGASGASACSNIAGHTQVSPSRP